jgi:signal transduction histidine kinase
VIKHSGVRKASVTVERFGELVRVVVIDAGAGFHKTQDKEYDGKGGFGLLSVSERLKLYGGQLDVDTNRKRGARITVTAPLDVPARKISK